MTWAVFSVFTAHRPWQRTMGQKEYNPETLAGSARDLQDKRVGYTARLLKSTSETLRRFPLFRIHSVPSLVRTLLAELNSLSLRIEFVCKTRPDVYGIRIGPAFHQSLEPQARQPNTETRACIQDIEILVALSRHGSRWVNQGGRPSKSSRPNQRST